MEPQSIAPTGSATIETGAAGHRRGLGWFGIGAVAVALLLAFAVSPFASSKPDGLEKVATEEGLDRDVREHAFADGPLADYSVSGIDDERLSTGVAGIIGVTVTLATGLGLFGLLRVSRRGRPTGEPPIPQAPSPTPA